MTAPPDTAALLQALERVREVRGSLELFDGLVRDEPAAVRDALAFAPRHPLRDDVGAWLAARGLDAPPPPDLAAALARHGISDLESWVEERKRTERRLGSMLADARADAARHASAANAYAAVSVLLAAAALLGWLAAFGVLPFQPEGPVPVPEPPAPESPR